MEIYFLRHGRSLADDEEKHEGRYDSPLTDAGRKEVHKRAAEWKSQGLKFDKIVASPLKRAYETAQIIGNALACQVNTDNDWMEMDNGLLAGLTFKEADERFPIPEFQNPYNRIAQGSGESLVQLHSRAGIALDRILQNDEGTYLIVAHGGILNAAIRTLMGVHIPINSSGLYFGFGDTGYLHTKYIPEKHIWIIKNFNPGFF